ncbi:Maltose-binding periplasmic protein [Hartmannibacter diazotrophicus]|uniref:Maltose-binding periplasmic protein n=1 Tax=Hartmannibacter diazotrophicus TaxID=1482074 RepID=A0A2C9DAM2_9HYPH|nr:ABC transporter substrate-binding protein [Hartmannibacter diazotrophicus]SON56791.1 Maltose-binding periplasmic protein [Hartmannibacter diazotrophicus]
MKPVKTSLLSVAAIAVAGVSLQAGTARADDLLFFSSQAAPVEEAQAVRDDVLAGSGLSVSFKSQDGAPFMTRVQAELEAGSGAIGLLGALHGQFASFADGLTPISGTAGTDTISPAFMDLSKLGMGEAHYVPWMQATYLMAANKKALQYLPEGADLNALTYDQLAAWAKAVNEATGSKKLGFPAGPKGLMHRFFEGYLYPSYTNSVVTKFRSKEAEDMWASFKTLWEQVNPAATSYAFMQEPLLTGDVWIAWDHAARLKQAFNEKPDDFVAFPVPAGPAGRGNMPVVAGLAIPKTSPDPETAKKLIAYLLTPEAQAATLKATGFFPVVDLTLPDDAQASAKAFQPAIAAQAKAADGVNTLLPTGLGEANGKFNKVYTDTFQRIVLAGQPIPDVLNQQAQALAAIMKQSGAPCWAPDAASEGACPVE